MKKDIKIAIYTNFFLGKQSTFIYREVDYFLRNLSVDVFAQRYSDKYFSLQRIKVLHKSDKKYFTFLNKIIKVIKGSHYYNLNLNRTWDKKNTIKYNLIHIHFGASALKFLESVHFKKPIIISIHGQDATKSFNEQTYKQSWLKLLKKIQNKPYLIIFPSIFLRDAFVNNVALPFKINTRVIPYGVNFKEIKTIKRVDSDIFTFIQVSGFQEKKGHIYTIKAFNKLIKSGYKAILIFIGSGDQEENCKEEVKKLKIEDSVSFLGYKKPNEVSNWLLKSDAFVHHSITDQNGDTEGLPNAIIEALGYGLPVLSTYHSGIPEIVKDGENGLLAKEKDIDKIFKNMCKIMVSKNIKPDVKAIREVYSIENHCQLILNEYLSLLRIK